jgi:hypothetical protein
MSGIPLTGFNDWSFGQVTAVVLLAAPLISIIEYFMEGESRAIPNAKAVINQTT